MEVTDVSSFCTEDMIGHHQKSSYELKDMMTQGIETLLSPTNNSSFEDYTHLDRQPYVVLYYVAPGFIEFTSIVV